MGLWLESDWVKIVPSDSTNQPLRLPELLLLVGLGAGPRGGAGHSLPAFGGAGLPGELSPIPDTSCPVLNSRNAQSRLTTALWCHDSEGDPWPALGVGFSCALCFGTVAALPSAPIFRGEVLSVIYPTGRAHSPSG